MSGYFTRQDAARAFIRRCNALWNHRERAGLSAGKHRDGPWKTWDLKDGWWIFHDKVRKQELVFSFGWSSECLMRVERGRERQKRV